MKEQDNIIQTNWRELFVQTEKWISDLSFYADELRFLNKLHKLYFSEMVRNENLDEVREEVIRFQDARYACKKLLKDAKMHLHQLVVAINNNGNKGNNATRQKHQALQQEMESFVLSSRANKKEIFSITQNVLERQKDEKDGVG